MIVGGFWWIWVFFLVDFSGCQWILMDFLWILVHFRWAPPSEKNVSNYLWEPLLSHSCFYHPFVITELFRKTTGHDDKSSLWKPLVWVFLTNIRFWCNYSLFGCSICLGSTTKQAHLFGWSLLICSFFGWLMQKISSGSIPNSKVFLLNAPGPSRSLCWQRFCC